MTVFLSTDMTTENRSPGFFQFSSEYKTTTDLTLKIASAQVVEESATNNSPS